MDVIVEGGDFELSNTAAHHFMTPNDEVGGFAQTANLLRRVADWIDERCIEDPEIESLVIGTSSGEESSYIWATLFYGTNQSGNIGPQYLDPTKEQPNG